MASAAEAGPSHQLSDLSERILSAEQAWGELGFDTSAHAPGKAGEPLQIGEKRYAKGLGHHANGAMVVLLDGEFAAFDAEVGLHHCGGGGSVVFRVLVDGKKQFESGVLRATNAAVPVYVALEGAQELRIEAHDAGDGITCDMANWADARLTRSTNRPPAVSESVNVAPFARVVTWDPNRMDGCRASRIEEFRAEDVFLETNLARRVDGMFAVPISTNGLACIGLQWLNRRAVREIALEFAEAEQMPATNAIQVQGWFGESAWQGNWRPLRGVLEVLTNRWVFRVNARGESSGLLQVQKVRWVFSATRPPVLVRNLSAFTRNRWLVGEFVCELESAAKGTNDGVRILNGEWVGDAPDVWNGLRPLVVKARYSRPSSLKSDATVLQFRLPTGTVSVAVEDLLANEGVYIPDHGLFVARHPAPITLAAYKQKIARRKTILQQVREMPDQTLEQAMTKTHHAAQREGPVMLSLACDNVKFVLERDGTLRFHSVPAMEGDWFANAGELRPLLGGVPSTNRTRHLEGGWFPIPVIIVTNAGIVYTQRSFAAPCDPAGDNPARLNRRSVCVVEFTASNTKVTTTNASLGLTFQARSRSGRPAQFTNTARGFFALDADRAFAFAETNHCAPLTVQTAGGALRFSGLLRPGETARVVVLLPGQDVTAIELPFMPSPNRLCSVTGDYWKEVLGLATQIETPDPLLNDVIRSSQVRCLIAARNEAGGRRIAPWIAAMSYGPLESEAHSVIRGMDFLGHAEFAQRGLDFFIHRYNTNGFLTTGYTTFGTAWHLWTLGEHCQLTRDSPWLRRVAPEITRVGNWIMRQTEKTKRPGLRGEQRPEQGLMPPGVLADWNAFAYHFFMNAYYHAALRGLGTALSEISESDARAFAQAADALREDILRAYRWTQGQSPALALGDGTWIPHYPSQVHSPGKLADFFPGQDAGRSWCYDVEAGAHQLVPTGVLPAGDREVTRMMDHMEDVQFLADGWFDYPAPTNRADWFNLGGFSKVQPYYTRNCEIYALRDDVKPFIRSYVNSIASLLNPEVLTFWEHFHHSGAWDKTHETGYFLHQTRTMLVQERGEELWLAPFATDRWLKDGMVMAVTNAPTRFGKVSYRIESHDTQGRVDVTIDCPKRRLPEAIVLRLRHPEGKRMRSVVLRGNARFTLDPTRAAIRFSPAEGTVSARVEF